MTSDVPKQLTAAVRVRRARAADGERLRDIARASKGYWGYDPERVDEGVAGLDVSLAGLRKKEFYVAEIARRVVGWSALIPTYDVCWLDDLWIESVRIGKGLGTTMSHH